MHQLMILCLLFVASHFAQALEEGDRAPALVLNQITPNGTEAAFRITDKDVGATTDHKVLEFISTTCLACQRNLPIVSALATDFEGQVTFRMIAVDKNPQNVRDYVSQKRDLIHYDVALDFKHKAARAFHIRFTPTLFVLDGNNTIVMKIIGVISKGDQEQMRQFFNKK